MAAHNLPQYAIPFVGRTTEIGEIANRLSDPDCRLLTLVGPGGIGKTRLAVQVATHHAGQFADGVYFVPLQPLVSPDFMVSTIADAAGFQFGPGGDPKHQLLDYFRKKALLLILDNLEHLSDGTGLLSKILDAAPHVRILATSRERLSLLEEWVFDVQELNYPTGESETDIEAYDAVQLFVQHARRVQADFALTSLQKPAVIRICRQAGGIPLALEMAASWVRVLTCEQIADEMLHSLNFLMTTAQNSPERHRSIRVVFDHSWRLLHENERQVFRGLSVFRGGFTLDAARKVTSTSLPVLAALTEKSLVRHSLSGRFDMHELLRQFSAEKLDEVVGEKETALNQHSAYYVDFLHRMKGDLRGKGEFAAMQAIEKDLDNVRACWDRLLERTDIEALHRCVETLQVFFHVRDRPYEGEKAFDRAIRAISDQESGTERDITLGWLLIGQGKCCLRIGQNQRAEELLRASVAILRRCNAPRELAWALDDLGCCLHDQGDYPDAARAHKESLTLGEAMDDPSLIAWSNYNLSYTTRTFGNYTEALRLMQASVARMDQTGDEDGLALAFHGLGNQLLEHGEYSRAKQFYEQSLAIHQRLGYQNRLSSVLEGLGNAAFALGDYAEARKLIQQSVAIARDLGFPRRLAYSLIHLGSVVHALGDVEEARRLFGEALSISAQTVDTRQRALALKGLGHIAFRLGAYAEAYQFYKESLSLNQLINLRFETPVSLSHLGQAAHGLRNGSEARQHFRDALSIGLELQIAPPLLETTVGIARLFLMEGELVRAVELLALALNHPACHQEMKDQVTHMLDQLEVEGTLPVYAAARQHGQAMILEDAAAELLAELSSVDKTAPHRLAASLSQRELEVLKLVADGFSNREIARELIFSLGTVKWYIHQIYGKLGVGSRTQAVARARELKLLL